MQLIRSVTTNMADITECMFTAGSSVAVVTCFDETIEGEVIAFDYNKKLLILKSTSSNQQAGLNDIHWVNLDFAKNVTIKKEVKKEEVVNSQLPQINTQRVEQRAKTAVEERKRLADAVGSGISEDGIRIYLALNKTIDTVNWDAENIIVQNSVRVQPPYKVDNCKPNGTHSQVAESVKYVKKLVEKYWNDQKLKSSTNNKG